MTMPCADSGFLKKQIPLLQGNRRTHFGPEPASHGDISYVETREQKPGREGTRAYTGLIVSLATRP